MEGGQADETVWRRRASKLPLAALCQVEGGPSPQAKATTVEEEVASASSLSQKWPGQSPDSLAVQPRMGR